MVLFFETYPERVVVIGHFALRGTWPCTETVRGINLRAPEGRPRSSKPVMIILVFSMADPRTMAFTTKSWSKFAVSPDHHPKSSGLVVFITTATLGKSEHFWDMSLWRSSMHSELPMIYSIIILFGLFDCIIYNSFTWILYDSISIHDR